MTEAWHTDNKLTYFVTSLTPTYKPYHINKAVDVPILALKQQILRMQICVEADVFAWGQIRSLWQGKNTHTQNTHIHTSRVGQRGVNV